jgi:hypothetical protein
MQALVGWANELVALLVIAEVLPSELVLADHRRCSGAPARVCDIEVDMGQVSIGAKIVLPVSYKT